jgi:hypothetical protein|tara:strand:- start:894 stop:1076 length:183 start_codon:yes stop_codon:yes gene_type:complete
MESRGGNFYSLPANFHKNIVIQIVTITLGLWEIYNIPPPQTGELCKIRPVRKIDFFKLNV